MHHEDAHAIEYRDNSASFWVLDGHGGEAAALYSAPELAKEFSTALEKLPSDLPADEDIERYFANVDSRLHSFVEANPEKDSGTTVVGALAVCQNGTYAIKLCNCGDSRGLVVRGPKEDEAKSDAMPVRIPQHLELLKGRPEAVSSDSLPNYSWPVVLESIDHKPSHPTEKNRIEAAGGHVSMDEPPRLDGNLAVSRGLGDFEYKGDTARNVPEQKVSCVPDVYSVSGLEPGSLLILACDGIWDVLTGEVVANYVRGWLENEPDSDLGDIAAELLRMCLRKNSRDNMTLMIVQCADGKEWASVPDEMKNYEKISEQSTDEARKYNLAFLQRTQFPPEPQPCAVCNKWIASMYMCPCKAAFYCTRQCQKKAWKAHKPVCPASGANSETPAAV